MFSLVVTYQEFPMDARLGPSENQETNPVFFSHPARAIIQAVPFDGRPIQAADLEGLHLAIELEGISRCANPGTEVVSRPAALAFREEGGEWVAPVVLHRVETLWWAPGVYVLRLLVMELPPWPSGGRAPILLAEVESPAFEII
ncbi:hypothetical protein IAT38_002789 [Cryptococcus sp. DSM 104549]